MNHDIHDIELLAIVDLFSNGDNFWKGLLIKSLCIMIIRISYISKWLKYLIDNNLVECNFSHDSILKLFIDIHFSQLILMSQSLIMKNKLFSVLHDYTQLKSLLCRQIKEYLTSYDTIFIQIFLFNKFQIIIIFSVLEHNS